MEPIIIIGMHRAGTSLLTRILQQSGVFIGNDTDNNNESLFFCKLNDWAFFQAGATWDNPYNLNLISENFILEVAANFKKHLQHRGIKKYHRDFKKLQNSDALWAWKDPRNTYTTEIWKQIFPNAKFIHIYRNPVDVAESLRQREIQFQKMKGTQTKTGIRKKINEYLLVKNRIYTQSLRVNNIEEGIKLWDEYTTKALSIKNNCKHLSYENLLKDTKNQMASIYNFLNIDINNKHIDNILKGINKTRRTAFINNDELVNEYRRIQKSKLVCKLKYDKLI
ncbi:MAG: sulfotransferase [Bacteroidales bacterium]|nr:sulfotransferase [Bacteroidales bacterium]